MALARTLSDVRHRGASGRVRNRLKDRIRLEGVATGLLLVVITALFVIQWVERHHRLAEDRRAICAIRDYIEGQFRITSSIAGTPAQVLIERRKVINRFEARMGGNCGRSEP